MILILILRTAIPRIPEILSFKDSNRKNINSRKSTKYQENIIKEIADYLIFKNFLHF